MIRAIVSFLFLSSLFAQEIDIYELPVKLKKQNFFINRIVKGHSGWTFYIDLDSRIVASQSSKGSFYFTGGFGDGYDSFIDPIGFNISNLDLYIFDRSENKVLRFDYSLNLINSLELSSNFNISNIVIDDMAVDSWGYYYLFSKNDNAIIRGNISALDPLVFIDLDQQMIDKDCGDKIDINSNGDIALLYPCLNQIAIFNRLGRLQYKLNISIDNPMMLTNFKNSWVVLNSEGIIELIEKSISKQFSIPLTNNEYLVDLTENSFNIFCLTNQRIIELHVE